MSPTWLRLLSKLKRKTLVELCRRPKIEEQIAGFIVDFSDGGHDGRMFSPNSTSRGVVAL
jgi:hypothetical protein